MAEDQTVKLPARKGAEKKIKSVKYGSLLINEFAILKNRKGSKGN